MQRYRCFLLLLGMILPGTVHAVPESPVPLRDRAAVERQQILDRFDRLKKRDAQYWESLRAQMEDGLRQGRQAAVEGDAALRLETERRLEEMRSRLDFQQRTLIFGLGVLGGWLSLFGFRLWRLQNPRPRGADAARRVFFARPDAGSTRR